MDNLQKETKEKLRLAIKAAGLEKYTDDLLKIARECIRVVATDPIDSDIVGTSRIGGTPDLEQEAQWPSYGYGKDKDAYSVFYFQLNLSELPFVIAPDLPEKGILSIFSTSQNQLEDDGSILYFKDINKLSSQRIPSLDEFGDKDLDNESNRPACFHKSQKIEFEVSISLPDYLYSPEFIEEEDLDSYLKLESLFPQTLKGEELGFMFSYFYQGMPEENDPQWFTLINLNSKSKYFSFGDNGNCGISLKRNSLKSSDFSESNFCYCE